ALADLPPVPVPAGLKTMGRAVLLMVRRALDAFIGRNVGLARAVCRQDDEVDQLNNEGIAELIHLMQVNPAPGAAGVSMLSPTRHLERIADHATNIAEDVVYLVEGEIVRHTPASREAVA